MKVGKSNTTERKKQNPSIKTRQIAEAGNTRCYEYLQILDAPSVE